MTLSVSSLYIKQIQEAKPDMVWSPLWGGTIDADAIIKAVDREPLARETPEGWKIMRPADHSVVEDCLWGQTTFNEKYGFSMPKSFDAIQGEEICRTDDELKQLKGK